MLLAGALLVGCATPLTLGSPGPSGSPAVSSSGGPLRYVALGDSYTIGTSVGESERWPNQLVAALHGTVELELVANLGVNGYATDDLLLDEMPRLASLAPDFVTLLIGVNDVVRGVPAERYAANVRQILDGLLAQLPADRIVVVSTPDYTRTPRGGDFGDSVQQRAAIAEFNAIIAAEAGARAISFVDIGPVADRADQDPSLVARDELHPSGGQYAGWVELIAPVVSGLIADDA